MMSFWLKPRQVIVMDARGGRPARNFYIRLVTIVICLLLLVATPFVLGSWYAPFHSIQKIIPENLKLKRQNLNMARKLADAETLNDLKDEQLLSLQEQMSEQESRILVVTKELHMFKSILDKRKGTGVHLLNHQADWVAGSSVAWQALLVKGGSFPRFLTGSYKLFATDEEGHRVGLKHKKMTYRFESHVLLKQQFVWKEAWMPMQLELIVYNSRKKEVLKKIIHIEGR